MRSERRTWIRRAAGRTWPSANTLWLAAAIAVTAAGCIEEQPIEGASTARPSASGAARITPTVEPPEQPRLIVADPNAGPSRRTHRDGRGNIVIEHPPDVSWDETRRYGNVKGGGEPWWSGARGSPTAITRRPGVSDETISPGGGGGGGGGACPPGSGRG